MSQQSPIKSTTSEPKIMPGVHDHEHNHDHDHDHSHSDATNYWQVLKEELLCHTPYAIYAVAFCLVVLTIMGHWGGTSDLVAMKKHAKMMFHSFHFMHIVFATTGTLITFFRFNKNIVLGMLVGIFTPAVFCLLSDAILPYIGGTMLGVNMHLHICFYSELRNILPFFAMGLLNGFIMSRHHSTKQSFYSISSHFVHILISALASTYYLVSHGFYDWHKQIGYVFLFLIFAVVLPCTFSDVVVPVYCARRAKKQN